MRAAWKLTVTAAAPGAASTRGSVAANAIPMLRAGESPVVVDWTSVRSECRLYGAVPLPRQKPAAPCSSATWTTAVAAIASSGMPPPPENTRAGTPKAGSSSASVVRTLRTGPTSLATVVWNTGISRVSPPSTCSTNVMSASAMPCCGNPALVLSTLTAITGPSLTGPPVSASMGGGGGGGGGGSGVGVGVGVGVGLGVGLGDAELDGADELGGSSEP